MEPHGTHTEEQTCTLCLGSAPNPNLFLLITSLSLFLVCFCVFYENVLVTYYDNLWLP